MPELPYDHTSPERIEDYARVLLNSCLRDALGDIDNRFSGKGKLGQLLEEEYFHYSPNSNSAPDFSEAGVELKTTPLEMTVKGPVSKERLVFNMIDFMTEHEKSFVESSFWKNNPSFNSNREL